MMNAMMCSSEVSSYCKQTNGTTFFFSFLHDVHTESRKGMSTVHIMVEIGHLHTSDLCDINDAKMLKDRAKKHIPMPRRKGPKT